jgi:hypothetical protein
MANDGIDTRRATEKISIGTRRRHDDIVNVGDRNHNEADGQPETSVVEVTVAQSFRTLGLGDLGVGGARTLDFVIGSAPPTGGAAVAWLHKDVVRAESLRGES